MNRVLLGVIVLSTVCSCSADDGSADATADPSDGATSGASMGTGGAKGTGGSGAAGGSSASGGAKGAGGAKGTGDSGAPGGSSASGGAKGTGGATNTGGFTGSGGLDAGPRVVRACPGADAASGVWEDITPPGVSLDPAFNTGAGKNYGTNAYVLDPLDTATIYLGTSAMGIHKTTDCGASWVKINTGKNAAEMDRGRQWTMVIDPVDPKIVYTVSGYGAMGLWRTTDGGVDWEQILAADVASGLIYGGFIAGISMDPTDHRHLVVSPHFTCNPPHTEGCLIETEDAGATWRFIENRPSSGEGAGLLMVDGNTWYWAQYYGGLWRTSDRGASWTRVAQKDGYAMPSLYRSPAGAFYIPAAFNVITSSDGIAWSTLSGSPSAYSITGSSTTMYISNGSCVAPSSTPYQPFSWADVAAPTVWKTLTGPARTTGGGYLDYDNDHHMLYSSACLDGFWRVKTP